MGHPSNALYKGEAVDFREAMRLYQQQMERENELTRNNSIPVTSEDQRCMDRLTECGRKAMAARAIYDKHVSHAEQNVIDELRATGDDEMIDFANGLENGDYSHLAI